jgi:signal transduction histidine kinase/PAS domain-containing protein
MPEVSECSHQNNPLCSQREFLEVVLNSLTHPFYVIDAHDYTVKMANSAAGLDCVSGTTSCYALTHKKNGPCSDCVCPLEIIKETRKPVTVEHIHYDEEGHAKHHEVHGFPIFDGEGNVIQIAEYCLDITERKQAEARQLLTSRIQERLHQKEEKRSVIRNILALIKDFTGFDGVGMRLREGSDFPYFEVNGLSDTFVTAENHLCVRDESGEPICDMQNHPVLQCMCGSVLLGRTDPSLPLFSKGGSFWTNSTTQLLASPPPETLGIHLRGRCNQAGYESVALIPLRCGQDIMGLLQLSDTQTERFTAETIFFWEGIAASIGLGLARIKAERELTTQQYFLQKAQEIGSIGTWELDIKTNELRWTDENYRIFGLPVGTKLTYETFLSCIHPDDRECVDTKWKAAFSKVPYDIEHRLLVDGKVKWVREKAQFEFNDRDECIRGIGFTQDITERKQALQEKEDLARFPEENPFPVLRIAQDGTVLYSNQTSVTLMKHWDCRDGQAIPEKWKKITQKGLTDGKPSVAEETIAQRVIFLIFCPILEENYVNVYGQDITERRQAMEHLRLARDQLQERVDQQTQTLRDTVQNLKTEVQHRIKTESRLRELTEELLNAEERQRQKTAGVLHDSIGAVLAFSKREWAELEKKAATAVLPRLKHIKDQIGKAIQQTRSLTMDLSPPTLRVFGLIAALEEFGEEFTHKRGLICSIQCPETRIALSEHNKILLYRSVCELLVNTAKHADAKQVTIQIKSTGNNIHIQVEDDGRGFDVAKLNNCPRTGIKTFGLFSIRERLTYMGGTFNIDSQPGRGTRVILQGPLQMDGKGD